MTTTAPVAAIALLYLRAGWPVLNLPPRAKGEPPPGRTGYDGRDMTEQEVMAIDWSGNIAIRMPEDVIGIDVDVYHGGNKTWKELCQRLGVVPPRTWSSHSSRGDGSGIYFYRVPVGYTWIHSLPGIEIIQRTHRYALVWPSIHPEGRNYQWYDVAEQAPTEDIPRVEDLPELPWAWIEYLSRNWEVNTSRAVDLQELEEFLKNHNQTLDPTYLNVILGDFRSHWHQGFSRHDSMVHCISWAMEYARAGVFPAQAAIAALQELWAEAIQPDHQRLSSNEFRDMVRHGIGKAQAKTEEWLREHREKVVGPVLGGGRGGEDGPTVVDQSDETWPIIDWTEVHDPEDDLVEGLIIPTRWVQFVAGAKGGKSSLIMFIAIELSEGRNPLDGSPVEPVTTLYCDGEQGRHDVEQLIRDCGHEPVALSHLTCSDFRGRLDVLDRHFRTPNQPTDAELLLRRVDQLKAKLVILDGLNGFINPTANENDSNTWNPFFRAIIEPLKRRNIAIVSGDNMGKDDKRGSRGSSLKNDKADAVIPVKRADSGTENQPVILKPSHARAGAYIKELVLESEGFDRSRPIRYWPSGGPAWAPGVAAVARTLDHLGVPISTSRRKARQILTEKAAEAEAQGSDPEPYRIRNDILGQALRFRRNDPIRTGTTPGTTENAGPRDQPEPPYENEANESPDQGKQAGDHFGDQGTMPQGTAPPLLGGPYPGPLFSDEEPQTDKGDI